VQPCALNRQLAVLAAAALSHATAADSSLLSSFPSHPSPFIAKPLPFICVASLRLITQHLVRHRESKHRSSNDYPDRVTQISASADQITTSLLTNFRFTLCAISLLSFRHSDLNCLIHHSPSQSPSCSPALYSLATTTALTRFSTCLPTSTSLSTRLSALTATLVASAAVAPSQLLSEVSLKRLLKDLPKVPRLHHRRPRSLRLSRSRETARSLSAIWYVKHRQHRLGVTT